MTITAIQPFYRAGVLIAAGPTQLSYSASDEADMVRRGVAAYVGSNPQTGGLVPAMVQTNPTTGLPELLGPDGVIDNLGYRGPLDGGTYGKALANMGESASWIAGQYASVSSVAYDWPDGYTEALRMDHSASTSQCRVKFLADQRIPCGSTVEALKLDSFGMWAVNLGATTRAISVVLRDTAQALIARVSFYVPPGGPHFLTTSIGQRAQAIAGNGVGYAVSVEQYVSTEWGNWEAGDSVLVGRIYANPRGKARFLVQSDDGYAVNIVPSPGANYPLAGASYVDILSKYGFKGTAYVPGANIGLSAAYMTAAQVQSLQNEHGWSIGSHSMTHPTGAGNAGLTTLGPANGGTVAAITADVQAGIDTLTALGIRDAEHFALPQGGWDLYVYEAIKDMGLKSIRGVGERSGTNIDTAQSIVVGKPCGGGYPVTNTQLNGWMHWPWSIQIDKTITEKSVSLVANATDLLTVTGHGWTASGAPVAFVTTGTSSSPPNPCIAAEPYWVIYIDANTIKLATSYANAIAGTAIDLLDDGVGTLKLIDLSYIKQFVDDCIRYGGLGTCYSHGLNYSVAIRLNFLCAYLKEKVDAGQMWVGTAGEWYAETGGMGY